MSLTGSFVLIALFSRVKQIATDGLQATVDRSGSHDMNSSRAYVPLPPALQPVRLIRRRNRFVVEARWDMEAQAVSMRAAWASGNGYDSSKEVRPWETRDILPLHLPNSGRMTELLQPGTLGLAHMDGTGSRGTVGTLLLVQYEGRWVSVDARMPNRLFARCLELGALPPFRSYTTWKAEVLWGHSRVDFLLSASSSKPKFLVETKSCNLVVQRLALFPDAPTARGARHLRELAEAVALGYRAAVVWFVQRDDADSLAAHAEADPEFARALDEARDRGVEAYAYRCLVEPSGITVLDEVPVEG